MIYSRLSCLSLLATLAGTALSPATVSAKDSAVDPSVQTVQILPAKFQLRGQKAIQQLSVVRVPAEDLTAGSREVLSAAEGESSAANPVAYGPVVSDAAVSLRSSAPDVVRVQGSVAHPVANGTAKIEAVMEGEVVASADVVVEEMQSSDPWSFRNDVQSVLARQGCNMGACHGALAGKGGFNLSLRGYDSESDYFAIARQARGRRIEIADPGRSLLLAKPTGALPHKGGLRLKVHSRDYNVLAEWIAAGATGPAEDDPRLEHITVTPQQSRLEPGDRTRILVTAHYDDGRVADVTSWAKFSATDESVAGVDENGWVDVRGSGEGAVLVWFGSRVRLSRMTVPYPNEVPEAVFAEAPRRNFIDELNLRQLQTLQLPPSDRCDDDAFLRRVTLDTIGRLPTPEEQSDYRTALAESGDTRAVRDAVIDRLLASEGFVDYWSYRISDILLINGKQLRPAAVKSYYRWVRQAVASGQPWDQMVREILTAKGVSTENGATNFYALHQTPEEMTENACQAFMGLSIACAKCHNHPLEKWTNDQYYAMANLFARVRGKGWGGEPRNGDGIRTVTVADAGELIQPSTGQPQPPAPLDAEPIPFDAEGDRRVPLAEWMTDPSNPYFSRAITNRVWANFFGRGLVQAVDDLRLSNPASNEALLTAASNHLVDAEFDLRSLMRAILQSETYQRSSQPKPGNEEDPKYLSRYYPRRLMAEVLLDSIDQTLETSTKFDSIVFSGGDEQETDFYPDGTRAIELYDASVESYFLQTFGRNPREITCECERSDEPSMVQVLHLSNGETLNPKLQAEDNWIARGLSAGWSDEEFLERLFQRALCRSPVDSERKALLKIMAQYESDQRDTGLRDAAWSVLTSTEFTFNH